MITLTREKTEAAFIAFCEAIFGRPEVENIKVRGVVIQRANLIEAAKKAVALSYHDCCSDVDLGICVRLPAEEAEYVKELGRMSYRSGDASFRRIADQLCAAALAYDRLAAEFYPAYKGRSADFFAIWECYDRNRLQQA